MTEAERRAFLIEAWSSWIDCRVDASDDDRPDPAPAELLQHLAELGVDCESLGKMRVLAEEYGYEP